MAELTPELVFSEAARELIAILRSGNLEAVPEPLHLQPQPSVSAAGAGSFSGNVLTIGDLQQACIESRVVSFHVPAPGRQTSGLCGVINSAGNFIALRGWELERLRVAPENFGFGSADNWLSSGPHSLCGCKPSDVVSGRLRCLGQSHIVEFTATALSEARWAHWGPVHGVTCELLFQGWTWTMIGTL
jgi:hypothetical protein